MSRPRSSIHLASDPWHALHLKPVQSNDLESALLNQLIDSTVQIAAAADDVLNRIQSVLPDDNLLVVAPAMLKEEKAAGRSQDAFDFPQGLDGIGDSAQCPGTDHRVELVVAIGKLFCCHMLKVKRERHRRRSRSDSVRENANRVDNRQARDVCRVVRKIETGAEADFQDRTTRFLEKSLPQQLKLLAAHHPVHEAWENVKTVKSHRGVQYNKDLIG